MRVKQPTATRRAAPEPNEHRIADIVGVLLVALAVLVLLSLVLSNTGILGRALGDLLGSLFGHGAWAVPFVIGFMGISTLRGRKVSGLRTVTLGLTLVFLSLVGALAKAKSGDYFDLEAVQVSGGYVGAVMGWLFGTLLGAAKAVGLGALLCVGAILCLDMPLHRMAGALRDRRRPIPREVASPATRRLPTHAVTRGLPDSETQEILPGIDEPTPMRKVRWKGNDEAKEASLARDVSVPKEGYQLPPLSILAEPAGKGQSRSKSEMEHNIETLEGTLEQFGIEANVVEVATGPTVTRYEVQLGPGVRVARITALADNIAMDLAASHVRVEAPIPGKAAIGVEVPNAVPYACVFCANFARPRSFAIIPRNWPSR